MQEKKVFGLEFLEETEMTEEEILGCNGGSTCVDDPTDPGDGGGGGGGGGGEVTDPM